MKAEQGLYYRSFKIDARAIDVENRSVDVSFSSEEPSKPYSWADPEILLHGDENVDLSYLKDLGSVLMNHQPRGANQPVVILGKPENVRIENKVGRATIVFDKDSESELAWQKVQSGSLRGVSVGALLKAITLVESGEEYQGYTGPAALATLWQPVEISLTPIPADGTVGVNKSLGEFANELKSGITNTKIQKTEESEMEEKDVKAIMEEMLRAFETRISGTLVDTVKSQLAEDAKPKMRVTSEQALDITGRAAAVSLECKSLVSDMILQGKNETDCLRTIGDQAALKDKPDNIDNGGLPNGTGIVTKSTGAEVINFKALEGEAGEDSFVRSLENPMQFSFGS